MPSLVLLSGGIDSCTVATLAVQQLGRENVSALALSYGQKHHREIHASERVAENLGIPWFHLDLPEFIFHGYGSSLMSERAMPHLSYQQLSEGEGVSPTYVPFRNGVMLSVATSLALSRGFDHIMIGVHAEDARNWAYPDCSPEFIGPMAAAVYVGTYHQVRLVAPLQYMLKQQVVTMGVNIGAPLDLTWSCYEGLSKHCGVCPTCVSRKHAFEAAGIEDPTEYLE